MVIASIGRCGGLQYLESCPRSVKTSMPSQDDVNSVALSRMGWSVSSGLDHGVLLRAFVGDARLRLLAFPASLATWSG